MLLTAMPIPRAHHGSGMRALCLIAAAAVSLFAVRLAVEAEQPRVSRVGIIHQGGSYNSALDGLRDELKELGWEEGKQRSEERRVGKECGCRGRQERVKK